MQRALAKITRASPPEKIPVVVALVVIVAIFLLLPTQRGACASFQQTPFFFEEWPLNNNTNNTNNTNNITTERKSVSFSKCLNCSFPKKGGSF